MISVIIPLYNKAASIGLTLRAVLEQTFQDFEVVVVDDGSTDGGADVVRAVDDARIRLVSQPNAGVSSARNRGVSESRGEFVAFLDADDLWRPTYLETQFALTRKYPDCDVFATNYEFRDAEGRISPTILRRLPFAGEDGILTNYFEVASCSHPPLWTSAVMVRRTALQAIGGFPVGIRSGEDLLTWARLAVENKIAYSIKQLAIFVSTASNTNTSKAQSRSGSEEFVLNELLSLYNKETRQVTKAQLKQYIIRWYKIYSVIQIEIGNGHLAVAIANDAIRFGGSVRTFLSVFILGIMPNKLSRFLFLKLR